MRGPLGLPPLGRSRIQRPGRARRAGGHSRPALCACRRRKTAPVAHTSSVCAQCVAGPSGPPNGAPPPFVVLRPLALGARSQRHGQCPPVLSTALRPWQGPWPLRRRRGSPPLPRPRPALAGPVGPRCARPHLPRPGPPLGLPSAVLSHAGPGPWASPPPVPVRSAAGGLSLRPAGRRSPDRFGRSPRRAPSGLPASGPCSLRSPAPSGAASRPGFPPPWQARPSSGLRPAAPSSALRQATPAAVSVFPL